MSTSKHFSETDVNGLIPQLSAIFDRLDALQTEIGARANELERVGVQSGASSQDSSDFVQQRRKYNHDLVEEYHKEIEKIAQLGGILQDADLKVVDFLSSKDGTDIHLMWQAGEDEIQYFRAPGDDFHRRQRLKTSK
jgi:hypothetical protein